MTASQHTKELPGYTYAIGAGCTMVLTVSMAVLQRSFDVQSSSQAIQLALFASAGIFLPMALPGYAFLKRWTAFVLAAGSQLALIALISVVLVLWK